jgi:ubiquinone/menaquinone biosynthesis C-methylase UbiE
MSATAESLKRALKWLLQLPADALIVSSKKLPNRILQSAHRSIYLADSFSPHKADQKSYILAKSEGPGRERGQFQLPMPPQDLWMGYGNSAECFLNSGKIQVGTMKKILESSGFSIKGGNRVLDFGCAAGRMIRWLDEFAEQCEIWGVDVSASHVIWCQQHLTPPFNFATVTTAPHLPFEDGYFDLIYAGSVFTHIADLADSWFLELKRILRPGGRLYITVHDKHSVDSVINHPERIYDSCLTIPEYFRNLLLSYYKKENIGELGFDMFTINRARLTVDGQDPMAHVFHDIDYLRRRWGRIMNIRSVTEEAYTYQTAIVLEK